MLRTDILTCRLSHLFLNPPPFFHSCANHNNDDGNNRSTPADIKRLMAYAPAMNSEFIVTYFGTLSRETSIDVMKEMLGKNMRQNLQMVVQIATAYSDQVHERTWRVWVMFRRVSTLHVVYVPDEPQRAFFDDEIVVTFSYPRLAKTLLMLNHALLDFLLRETMPRSIHRVTR